MYPHAAGSGAPAGINRNPSAPADPPPETADQNKLPAWNGNPRRAVSRQLFQDEQTGPASEGKTEDAKPMDWSATPAAVYARVIMERRAQQGARQDPENRPFVIHVRNSQGLAPGMSAACATQVGMAQATAQSTTTTTTTTATTTTTTSSTVTTTTSASVSAITTTSTTTGMASISATASSASPYKVPAPVQIHPRTRKLEDRAGYVAEDESGSDEYEDALDGPGPVGFSSFADPYAFGEPLEWDPGEDELIGIISDRDPKVLIEEESITLWAAAKQPSTVALEMLLQSERGIAFHPYERAGNRGWHPEHCPFLASIKHNRPDNLRLLLQHGVLPGKALELALPKMPGWARDVFRQFDGYLL